MDNGSMKRPADFTVTDDSSQKRSRTSIGYPQKIDTDAAFRRSSISSRSPGSPKQHSLPSAEVAADFKDSLQDLHANDRYQISNLTIIAKESTEHALAISRVLETHIRTISPLRKLPALYVLDSIVKNVGTPYTIYLGQNLYKTFMDAYTLVDGQTRKNMEGMLKTWKEPIPGSMEARPVFPVDIVRPIENALIKARTAFVQQQQQQARTHRQFHALPPRPNVTATPQHWPSTPTHSQSDSRLAPTPMQPPEQRPSAEFQYGNHAPTPNYQPHPVVQSPLPPFYPNQFPLPPPQQYQQLQPAPQPIPTPPPPPGQFQKSYSLIALLQAAGTYPSTPQPQQPAVTLPSPPQPAVPQGLEALLKYRSTPDVKAPAFALPNWPPPPPPANSTPIPQFAPLAVSTPPATTSHATQSIFPPTQNDVQLTVASLKIPRPHLLSTLYSSLPSQCATCGRRFPPDPAGKARKARHLDAHFRTNRSMADAARRGMSRNWYLDELDWIRSREFDDADEAPAVPIGGQNGNGTVEGGGSFGGAGGGGGGGGDGPGPRKQKEVYVKAPADAAVARHACPICQEEFGAIWHDGAQEWVWMDAVNVGGRAYHQSCLEELAKDKGNAGGGSSGLGLGVGSKMKGKVGVKAEVGVV